MNKKINSFLTILILCVGCTKTFNKQQNNPPGFQDTLPATQSTPKVNILTPSIESTIPHPTIEPSITAVPEPTANLKQATETPGRIAFVSDRDSNYEIYVMDTDGSNQTNLTNNPADDLYPTWSPDGRYIAFYSNRDGNDEIYVMSSDGSDQTRLTNDPAADVSPAWSPDGKHIAFISYRDGVISVRDIPVGEVYIMNTDGSNQGRLTNDLDYDYNLAWSPDGKQFSLCSTRRGISGVYGFKEIYIVNIDNSNQTRLTDSPFNDCFPSWSLNGEYITFVSTRDGNSEIYTMKADGSDQTRLTYNHSPSSYNLQPNWSPDGSRIVFASRRDGNYEIYLMNADGSDQTRLTNNPFADSLPAWSPGP